MKRIDNLLEKVKLFYNNGDPSHDVAHVKRVMDNCKILARSESQVNLEVLLAAAILHDIVNMPKNHPERKLASELAAKKSRSVLLELEFSENEVEHICNVITEHSFSLAKSPSTIESQILQDADKLDALGAIGIMRTVTCGARMHTNYYDTQDPFAKARSLDDKNFTLDHFYTKLFLLPALMNTSSAKKEALVRIDFMKKFISQLDQEISSQDFS